MALTEAQRHVTPGSRVEEEFRRYPDHRPTGQPVLPNGLALCKIHHAAFDRNILGIPPDYVVQIHRRLLADVDGPMLVHGLQHHHGRSFMRLPRRRADQPDPDRLLERFAEFEAA